MMNMKKILTSLLIGTAVSACNIAESHAGVDSSFENVMGAQQAVASALPLANIDCPGIYDAVQSLSRAQKVTLVATWAADLKGTPAQRMVMQTVLMSCALTGQWEPMK